MLKAVFQVGVAGHGASSVWMPCADGTTHRIRSGIQCSGIRHPARKGPLSRAREPFPPEKMRAEPGCHKLSFYPAISHEKQQPRLLPQTGKNARNAGLMSAAQV